jgi:hypothetical protein
VPIFRPTPNVTVWVFFCPLSWLGSLNCHDGGANFGAAAALDLERRERIGRRGRILPVARGENAKWIDCARSECNVARAGRAAMKARGRRNYRLHDVAGLFDTGSE